MDSIAQENQSVISRIPVLRPFLQRNFRLMYIGQGVSVIGTWMATIAMSWLVYRLTGSATLLGVVTFLGHIPQFILGPFVGAVADRYDRLVIVKVAQFVMFLQAIVMAVLVLTNSIQIWHILALSLVMGIALSFEIPARKALQVSIVGLRDIPNAIGLNSSMFNGARMVGPAIAGVIIANYGEGICFAINAISFLAVLISLWMIDLKPWKPKGDQGSVFDSMREGIRAALESTPIRKTLVLVAFTSIVGLPFLIMLPAYVKTVLVGDAKIYGWVMACSGAGAFVAALTIVQWVRLEWLPRRIAIAATLFGAGVLIFSQIKSLPMAMIVMFLLSYAFMVQVASSNTLIQLVVDDKLRGRVMAIYAMMFLGILPFGSLLMGWLTDKVGAQQVFSIIGILMLIGGAVFYRFRPSVVTEPPQSLEPHTFAHEPSG